MPIHNSAIADQFNELADLLEIQGENPFRVRAYRNAARVVVNWPTALADELREGDLPRIPGVGKDLALKIGEIIHTGKLPLLERIRRQVPEGLTRLMRIQGLGPKRVKTLQRELGIRSVEDLRKAAEAGKVRELRGFGAKSEEKILAELERSSAAPPDRISLPVAEQVAIPLVEYLKSVRGVKKVIVGGSFRRRAESVGDLDLLVSCTKSSLVMDRLEGP